MLRRSLQDQIEMYARVGQPAFAERFILRNAGDEKRGKPRPAGVGKRRSGRCFYNAHRLAEARGWQYAEGFAWRDSIGFPIHHAWTIDEAGEVVDPTWERPWEASFLGVVFDWQTIARVQLATGVYGMLANAWAWNVSDPMLVMDPGLAAEVEAQVPAASLLVKRARAA